MFPKHVFADIVSVLDNIVELPLDSQATASAAQMENSNSNGQQHHNQQPKRQEKKTSNSNSKQKVCSGFENEVVSTLKNFD